MCGGRTAVWAAGVDDRTARLSLRSGGIAFAERGRTCLSWRRSRSALLRAAYRVDVILFHELDLRFARDCPHGIKVLNTDVCPDRRSPGSAQSFRAARRERRTSRYDRLIRSHRRGSQSRMRVAHLSSTQRTADGAWGPRANSQPLPAVLGSRGDPRLGRLFGRGEPRVSMGVRITRSSLSRPSVCRSPSGSPGPTAKTEAASSRVRRRPRRSRGVLARAPSKVPGGLNGPRAVDVATSTRTVQEWTVSGWRTGWTRWVYPAIR